METAGKAVSKRLLPDMEQINQDWKIQEVFEGCSNTCNDYYSTVFSDLSNDLNLENLEARLGTKLPESNLTAQMETFEEVVSELLPPADVIVKQVYSRSARRRRAFKECRPNNICKDNDSKVSSDFAHDLELDSKNVKARLGTLHALNLATQKEFEEPVSVPGSPDIKQVSKMQEVFEGFCTCSNESRLLSNVSHDIELENLMAQLSTVHESNLTDAKKTFEEPVSEPLPPADVKQVHPHLAKKQQASEECSNTSEDYDSMVSSDFAHDLELELENVKSQLKILHASNLTTQEKFEEPGFEPVSPQTKQIYPVLEVQEVTEGCSNKSEDHDLTVFSNTSHDLELENSTPQLNKFHVSNLTVPIETFEEAADVKEVTYENLVFQDAFEGCSNTSKDDCSMVTSNFADILGLELENFKVRSETSHRSNLATQETFEEPVSKSLSPSADLEQILLQMDIERLERCMCNDIGANSNSTVTCDFPLNLKLELENLKARLETLHEQKFNTKLLVDDLKQVYCYLKTRNSCYRPNANLWAGAYKNDINAIWFSDAGQDIMNIMTKYDRYHSAIRLLTVSIAYAPLNSLTLAEGYARRAVALMNCDCVGMSLLDLNRALMKPDLPNTLEGSLQYLRKCCLSKLTRVDEIVKINRGARYFTLLTNEPAIHLTRDYEIVEIKPDAKDFTEFTKKPAIHLTQNYEIVKINPDAEDFSELTNELAIGIVKINPYAKDLIELLNDLEIHYVAPSDWEVSCRFDNTLLPYTTSKIKLEFDEKRGRYFVATKDIEPGEILSSEKFFLLRLAPDRIYQNCAYCLCSCVKLVPCPRCSMVMYCSQECCNKASDLYHLTECQLWSCYDNIEKIDEHLALSVQAFLIGTQQGKQLSYLMKRLKIEDIIEPKDHPTRRKRPFVTDYFQILKMLREFEPSEMRNLKLMETVMNIIIKLQQLSFFKNTSSCRKSGLPDLHEESFAALLILNHYVSFKNRTLLVPGMDECYALPPRRGVQLASGICSLHSLINRSNKPNVFGFVQREQHVLFAIKKIESGEELFLSNYFDPFVDGCMYVSNADLVHQKEVWEQMWNELEKRKNKTKFLISKLRTVALPLLTKGEKILSGIELLDVIIDITRFLSASKNVPSSDIDQCGRILAHFTAFLYDDYSHCFEIEFFRRSSQFELLNLVMCLIDHMTKDGNT